MNNTPYIGFFRRAIAFIIDSILVSIPPAAICGPMMFWLNTNTAPNPTSEEALLGTMASLIAVYLLWQLLGLICYWLYFALLESGAKQATFGKRIMGIKVVDEKGERISFARATGRVFAKFLSYATMYIGFIMAGNTSRKRALHDFIAQTYVVSNKFQPGDELPETKSHMIRLGLIIAAMALLSILGLLALIGNSTPVRAQTAATRLQQLAKERRPLREPLLENGITYTLSRSGYRAQFEDMEAETYTLWLQPRTGNVCCETFPGATCRQAAIPECN